LPKQVSVHPPKVLRVTGLRQVSRTRCLPTRKGPTARSIGLLRQSHHHGQHGSAATLSPKTPSTSVGADVAIRSAVPNQQAGPDECPPKRTPIVDAEKSTSRHALRHCTEQPKLPCTTECAETHPPHISPTKLCPPLTCPRASLQATERMTVARHPTREVRLLLRRTPSRRFAQVPKHSCAPSRQT